MYYFPKYYSPYDYYHYFHSPEYYYYKYGVAPQPSVTTRFFLNNPYISSYSGGRYSLLRNTPFYTSYDDYPLGEERLSRSLSRAVSVPREVRASSIPPRSRAPSPVRASSVPPENTRVSVQPKVVHYSPNMVDSRVPVAPGDKPSPKMTSANPVSFGPRIYTNLSVFPSNRHSSYSLLTPIDRYKYRTSTIPTKVYSGMGPSMSYHSYPTPTGGTSNAYRKSDMYPTRFQINRITSPTVNSFYAGRRTLY